MHRFSKSVISRELDVNQGDGRRFAVDGNSAVLKSAGVSDPLRATFIEQHGAALGQHLFEAEISRRLQRQGELLKLQAQRDALDATFNKRGAELAALLVPLRASMDAAYAAWLCTCEALEAQRIRNEQELEPLRCQMSEIDQAMRGPSLFEGRVKQWQTPDWAREQPNAGPMPHK